jgi:hypothetical protein
VIRLLVEGDYHCGDIMGLGNPEHWPARKRKASEALWEWRRERLREIGPVDIHVLGGDLVHGTPDRHAALGLLTSDLEEQVAMAQEAVAEVKAAHRYFAWGTPRHTADGNMRLEGLVAAAFGERPHDEVAIGPMHGVRLVDRHIVGRSDIPYGQGTPLWREWVRDQIRAVMEDFHAASVHVRHHVHYYFEVRNAHGLAVTCPCWELPRAKGLDGAPYPLGLRTQYYTVGALLIEIDKSGEVFVRPQIMPLKITSTREYLCPKIADN